MTTTTLLWSPRSGLLDLVQDQVEGDPLLVEQHELLAGADLLGGDGEQLLARRDAERSRRSA